MFYELYSIIQTKIGSNILTFASHADFDIVLREWRICYIESYKRGKEITFPSYAVTQNSNFPVMLGNQINDGVYVNYQMGKVEVPTKERSKKVLPSQYYIYSLWDKIRLPYINDFYSEYFDGIYLVCQSGGKITSIYTYTPSHTTLRTVNYAWGTKLDEADWELI